MASDRIDIVFDNVGITYTREVMNVWAVAVTQETFDINHWGTTREVWGLYGQQVEGE